MTAAKPLVLVTRPAEDAERTAALLAAHGYDALVEPLIAIEPAADAAAALGDLAGVAGLVFTSANGVRAFAGACARRDLPVFAVGPATAEAARSAGFADVRTASGDVDALATLVAAACRPEAGPLLHVAGEVVAGDLAGRLAEAGFAVQRAVLYRARPAAVLTQALKDTLARNRLAAALFFSPRTAQTFVRLIRTSGLEESCRGMAAICLSRAVADAIGGLPWRATAVAATPTMDAALAALGQAVPAGGGPDRQRGRSIMTDHDSRTPDGAAPADPAAPAPAIAIGAGEVIQRFGGIRPMAAKLGISFSTVQGWKERNQIPASRHGEIRDLADRLGISLAPDAAPPPSPASDPPPAAAAPPEPPPAPPRAPAMDPDAPPPIPPPLPPQAVVPPPAGLGVGGAALVSIVVVALALAGAYVARPYWQAPGTVPVPAEQGDIVQRLAQLETQIAARPAPPPTAPDPKLAQDVAAAIRKTGDLETALAKRAAELESALAVARRDLAQAGATAAEQARALAARIEALEKGFDPQGFVALRTALNELGGRIDALGKRLDQAEKAAATARAQGLADAALALAAGQLRRAVDSGQPYSAELAACRALAGGDDKVKAALDALAPMAGAGIATRAALADSFADTAAAIARAALQHGETGWLRAVIDRLDALVTIRPVGANVAGETPRARAARAEAMLARGDLAGAVQTLGGLDGKPAEAARAWLERAQARLAAEAALAALEAQATAHVAAGPGAAR